MTSLKKLIVGFGLLLWAGVQLDCAPEATMKCTKDEECPSGRQWCDNGVCRSSICPDKPCEDGNECVGGTCYPKDCATRICPGKGEICQEDQCAPKQCMEKDCLDDKKCAADGECYPVNCEDKLCSGYGEVCVNGTECQQRACVGVNCPDYQQCANGYCYPSVCGGVTCPTGEVCGDSEKCVEKSCANVTCDAGKRCANGKCWDEDCQSLTCADDQVCENGVCMLARCVENRCACKPETVTTDCQPGQVCNQGVCCTPEEVNGETLCKDLRDNDCDSLADCLDPQCDGKSCDDNDSTKTCQETECKGPGSCTPTENPEATCNDNQDNDCDSKKDCLDDNCSGKSCNDGNAANDPDFCQGTACVGQGGCTSTENPESTCTDNQDNDCDSKTDCADENCDGKSCNDGNGSNDPDLCQGGVCKGTGSTCTPGDPCNDGTNCPRCGRRVKKSDCSCECVDPKSCEKGETSKMCGSVCGNGAYCDDNCDWICDCAVNGGCWKDKKYSVCDECQSYTVKSCIRNCPGSNCVYAGGGLCGTSGNCDLSYTNYYDCTQVGCCGSTSPPSGC